MHGKYHNVNSVLD